MFNKPAEYKSFYKTVGGGEAVRCNYPTRLDLYGCGCEHDCRYCYAKSLLDFRGLWHPNDVHVADESKVLRKIAKLQPGSVVRMGGMTDDFAPVEARNRISEAAIKALNDRGVHQLIVTKSPMIASAEYMDVLSRGLAHIQITVTTTDREFARWVEPGAPSPKSRIEAVKKLQDEGFDVQLRMSPFLKYDLEELDGIDRAVVEFLRVNTWIERWVGDYIDLSRHTLKDGGYRHLQLEDKLKIIDSLRFRELTVCDDVLEHYLYFQEHVNFNKRDCCNLRIPKWGPFLEV